MISGKCDRIHAIKWNISIHLKIRAGDDISAFLNTSQNLTVKVPTYTTTIVVALNSNVLALPL